MTPLDAAYHVVHDYPGGAKAQRNPVPGVDGHGQR